MNKKNLSLIIVALGVVACNHGKEGIKPVVKPLVEAVYASGFVVSEDEYEVISQAEGTVTEKLVSEGDAVKKGDPLYIISADQQNARNRIAHETYELAQKNFRDDSPVLRELRAALESARTKMQYDSANHVRFTSLLKSGATSQAEYDRVKLMHESSLNEYTLVRSRYEKTRNQLALELENARNNLVISQDEAGRYIVRSQENGLVFMMAKDRGEMIRRSEVIAVIGRQDSYVVQLNIDELDVHRVREGQQVLVKIDAYPDKLYEAKIRKIFPMVDRKQQAIRADAVLLEKLPGNFSGLALEGNIIINRKENAMVIPKSSLLPGDSVLIRDGNNTHKVKVTKGIETLDEVEVVAGLDSSQRIVMNNNE